MFRIAFQPQVAAHVNNAQDGCLCLCDGDQLCLHSYFQPAIFRQRRDIS